MRAAAFIAGVVISIGLYLAIAAASGFGAAAIGIGSLAIMVVGAAAFVMSQPRVPSTGVTLARWES